MALAIEEDAVLFEPYRAQVDWTEYGIGRARARDEGFSRRTEKEVARSVGEVQRQQPRTRPQEPQIPQQLQPLDLPNSVEPLQQPAEGRETQGVHRIESVRGRAWRKKARPLPPQGLAIALPEGTARSAVENHGTTLGAIPSATQSLAFPKEDEICKLVENFAATRDARQLDHVALLMLQALAPGADSGQPLLNAATLLSMTCQGLGRFDTAAKILKSVLQVRLLTEDEYYAFRPLDLLEKGLLPELERCRDGLVDDAKLVLAADLYVARLQEKPVVQTEQGFDIGKRLLDLAFSSRSRVDWDKLYRRCTIHHPSDFVFTQWFITQLHRMGDYKRAIDFFELTYRRTSPSQASILETGRVVVQSVAAAKGMRAPKVLEVLAQLCYPASRIPSEWVTRIFESHWERFRDMDSIMGMFSSLRDHAKEGLRGLVSSPPDVYRAMVVLSTKANRPELTKVILEKQDQDMLGLASDVAFMGSMALDKAKSGDWMAVEEDFARMKSQNSSPEDMAQAFTPILKIYAESHTIADTDAFLRHFITHVGVPLCKGTATFMAKEYGAVRDAESLVAWLEYIVQSGFAVDAAFTNSILSNCYLNWKLPWRKLRLLQRKIHTLSGGALTDRNTNRIMFEAAVAHSKRESIDFRLRQLKVHVPRAAALAGRSWSSQDILMTMKDRMAHAKFDQALTIYRRALAKQLRLPIRAHQLAIKAILQRGLDNIDEAYTMADHAEKEGHSISSLVFPIVFAQLRGIRGQIRHTDENTDEKYRDIKRLLLEDLPRRGIPVSDSMYNMAAKACLGLFHNTGAIHFATLAAETYLDPKAYSDAETRSVRAEGKIGYNLHNFEVLVQAFARIADPDMLRLLLTTARNKLYWTDKRVRDALKHARRDLLLPSHRATPKVLESRQLVAAALEETAARRVRLAEERDEVEADLFTILQRAADDAGRQRLAAVPVAERKSRAALSNPLDEIEKRMGGMTREERTGGKTAVASF